MKKVLISPLWNVSWGIEIMDDFFFTFGSPCQCYIKYIISISCISKIYHILNIVYIVIHNSGVYNGERNSIYHPSTEKPLTLTSMWMLLAQTHPHRLAHPGPSRGTLPWGSAVDIIQKQCLFGFYGSNDINKASAGFTLQQDDQCCSAVSGFNIVADCCRQDTVYMATHIRSCIHYPFVIPLLLPLLTIHSQKAQMMPQTSLWKWALKAADVIVPTGYSSVTLFK